MSDRQQKILFAIIQSYIETAEPVSSKAIANKFNLSPATLRAEMAWLEEEGYLKQPHISSGRVPTDIGYRFYVDKLMQAYHLTRIEKQQIESAYNTLICDLSLVLKKTAHFMASFLDCSSLITSPDLEDIYDFGTTNLIQKPEFNDVEKIRKVIEIMEDKARIIDLLNDELVDNTITLKIGSETNSPNLEECSLIAARYKIKNQPGGIVSIITCKRVQYNKIESALKSIVSQIDKIFEGGEY